MHHKASLLVNDNIPLVEAAHYGGRQRPTAILLRTSWTTGVRGAANGIAQAWHNPNNRVDSCHYVVDEAQLLRCVPDKVQACLPLPEWYKGAISINVCHNPPEKPNPLVVSCVARLTAQLCIRYHIPIRILNAEDERRWLKHKWKVRGGIILKTVGAFPSDEFFISVMQEATIL